MKERRAATVPAQLKAPASEVLATPVAIHDDAGQADHEHPAGEHTVEHTGSDYLFAGGKVIVSTGGTTPRQYADDVKDLLTA